MLDQAIVFVTHSQSERVLRHFGRLRAETRGLLATFLCVHDPSQLEHDRRIRPGGKSETGKDMLATEFRVDETNDESLLPRRYAQMRRAKRSYNTGFTDLTYMPALSSRYLSSYDYVWVVEYDVDFAGNWREFFLVVMRSQADFLGANLYPRQAQDNWVQWSWFSTPPGVPHHQHVRSFNPISRFSRRMISLYLQAMQSDLWQGHTEALLPTIALEYGLSISDLGGRGPFCPEQWRGKNYHYDEGYRSGTFVHAPPVQFAYFHEKPGRFIARNVLYHPVKVDMSLGARAKLILHRLARSPMTPSVLGNFITQCQNRGDSLESRQNDDVEYCSRG
jgi:hypothetical protein